MADTGHNQIIALASEIAGMVRREGLHDFKRIGGANGHECSTASLCGLCVHSNGDELLRIHAADLDLAFDRPANNRVMAPAAKFRKGTLADLTRWHRQLGGLHAFLTPLQRAAA